MAAESDEEAHGGARVQAPNLAKRRHARVGDCREKAAGLDANLVTRSWSLKRHGRWGFASGTVVQSSSDTDVESVTKTTMTWRWGPQGSERGSGESACETASLRLTGGTGSGCTRGRERETDRWDHLSVTADARTGNRAAQEMGRK
uniref:Uncharacterized protein n=1 Tax=Phyllostachys edulis TaxID=38705 RepID=D3IVL6_PHYED|nr:hypothetical protein [Phyllostachys edulis]